MPSIFVVEYGPTPRSRIIIAQFSDKAKADKYAANKTLHTPYEHFVREVK